MSAITDLRKKSSEQEKIALFGEMTAEEIDDLPAADKKLFEEAVSSERKHLINLQNKKPTSPALSPVCMNLF